MTDINRDSDERDAIIATRIIQCSKAILAFGTVSVFAQFLLTAFAIKGTLTAIVALPPLFVQGSASGGLGLLFVLLHKKTDETKQKLAFYIHKIKASMGLAKTAVSTIAVTAAAVKILDACLNILGVKTNSNPAEKAERITQLLQSEELKSKAIIAKSKAIIAEQKKKVEAIEAIREDLNSKPIPPEVSVMVGGAAMRYFLLKESPYQAIVNQASVTASVMVGGISGKYVYRDGRIRLFDVAAMAITAAGIEMCRDPGLRNQSMGVMTKKVLPRVVNPIATRISMSFLSGICEAIFQPQAASVLSGITSAGIGIACEIKTRKLLESYGAMGAEIEGDGVYPDDDNNGEMNTRHVIIASATGVAATYFVGKIVSNVLPSWMPSVATPIVTGCVVSFAPTALRCMQEILGAIGEQFVCTPAAEGDGQDLVIEKGSNPLKSYLNNSQFSGSFDIVFMVYQQNKQQSLRNARTFTPGLDKHRSGSFGVTFVQIHAQDRFEHQRFNPAFDRMKRPNTFTPCFNRQFQSGPMVSDFLPCPGRIRQALGTIERGTRTLLNRGF